MNYKERLEHPEDSFDCGYHLYVQEKYKERVAKNPERLAYAVAQLTEHNIRFEIKNSFICHIHAWRKKDGALMQFWAGTGKIFNSKKRGIDNFIKLLEQ